MAKLIGQSGSVMIGVATYEVSRWEMTFEADLPDVTDTGSGGYQSLIEGIKKASGSFTMFVDGATLVADASAFAPGTSATLILNVGSTGKSYSVPSLIKSQRVTNPAKDPVELEAAFESTGSITLPA